MFFIKQNLLLLYANLEPLVSLHLLLLILNELGHILQITFFHHNVPIYFNHFLQYYYFKYKFKTSFDF